MVFRSRLPDLIIIIIFIFSCSADNKDDYLFNYKIKRFESKVEALVKVKGDIVRGNSILLYKDSTYVSYINVTKAALYYSNLSSSNPIFKTISLPQELVKDSLNGTVSSFSIDFDSTITIFQSNRITLYNFKTKKTIYQRDISITDNTMIVFQDHSFPLFYDVKKNVIYSQIFHSLNKEQRKYPFDLEFLAEINVSLDSIFIVPLKYPRSYNKGELGKNSKMKVTFKGDSIICSSSNEPYISVYDVKTKNITNHEAKSTFQKEMKKLPLDELWNSDLSDEIHLQSFRYENILYDEKNKLFYRMYVKEMNLKNDSGYFNTFRDRKTGLLILDQHFKKLGEIELPDDQILWYGVGRDGFYYSDSFEIKNDTLFKKYVAILPNL